MDYSLTKKAAEEQITAKLSHFFGVTPEEANYEQFYKAIAMITRDMLRQGRHEFEKRCEESGSKRVYYLCMEFLMGRSLKNTLYNLNLTSVMEAALKDFGIKLDKLYDCEPDAGLGNGGLGRLAACYLDALATDGYLGMGYSILYEYGIFKQKLVDGWQTEMPDFWLPGGEVWLVAREEKSVDVSFEGNVVDRWEDGYHSVDIENAKKVHAVPYDMMVAGKDGKGVSVLRLWSAKSSEIDMNSFNQGDYLRAMEQNAMAEVISKVLYPADNHPEGKSLRLRQQYLLVSSSLQSILNEHLKNYHTLDNLAEKVAVHINDTHPTLCIPELMRLLLDEYGYGWDQAWDIATHVVSYTNHTVMAEALEKWPQSLFQSLLPRIYQIVQEINQRFCGELWAFYPNNWDVVNRNAILSNGQVKMANLCLVTSHTINGVSALHSDILKNDVFADYYRMHPEKFTNVTNGITHRRWVAEANPRLASLINELIGDGWLKDADKLQDLQRYMGDRQVLDRLADIKRQNKQDLAKYILEHNNVEVNPDSIFDVQVKRLHEYKRQLLNALNILDLYLQIKDNPNLDIQPRTFIFGAKAASAYYMAKQIIRFICALGDLVNNDPDVKGRLKVVFLENYRVSLAEIIMPAAEVSEQISLAGKEASGTGNMKLMMNGAITLGTEDGANVEIHSAVGDDNIIIFGMQTPEVLALQKNGYSPLQYYNNNAELKAALDFIGKGIAGQPFENIYNTLKNHDTYMALADFADYRKAQQKASKLYADTARWEKMSLTNIAQSGIFSADRSIEEYAKNIWHISPVE